MPEQMWLTPEQAAAASGRSMIAIRALIETTLEQDGTKHLLQVFDGADSYEAGYLLHRSLVTTAGLGQVSAGDVVERLTARIQELESALEVERFRAASRSARIEASQQPAQPVVVPATVAPPTAPVPAPSAPSGRAEVSNRSFWVILGILILITFVIVMYILFRQGFLGPRA